LAEGKILLMTVASRDTFRSTGMAALQIGAVAALYYATGKLGLLQQLVRGQVTPLWPPTGIALAGLLLIGPRVWPGIALGAFLINIPPVLTACHQTCRQTPSARRFGQHIAHTTAAAATKAMIGGDLASTRPDLAGALRCDQHDDRAELAGVAQDCVCNVLWRTLAHRRG
jgi:hypothetical protein